MFLSYQIEMHNKHHSIFTFSEWWGFVSLHSCIPRIILDIPQDEGRSLYSVEWDNGYNSKKYQELLRLPTKAGLMRGFGSAHVCRYHHQILSICNTCNKNEQYSLCLLFGLPTASNKLKILPRRQFDQQGLLQNLLKKVKLLMKLKYDKYCSFSHALIFHTQIVTLRCLTRQWLPSHL